VQAAEGLLRPAVELVPQDRAIHLGLRPAAGGDHAVQSGAVLRRVLPLTQVDWSPAVRWLATPEAQALQATIVAGHQASMLWSGDHVVSWTPEAGIAIEALLTGIEASLHGAS
jgi:hypothetical protein